MTRHPWALRWSTLLLAAALAGAAVPAGAQTQPGPEIAISSAQYPGTTASVAPLAGGGFVVVWRSAFSVVARRLDASGIPQGPDFVVSAAASGAPAVAAHPSGRYLVAWSGNGGIVGRLYDASGAPATPETLLVPGALSPPRVSASASGYVVAWANPTVFARLFDPMLSPRTGALTVSAGTAADVACRGDGSCFVAFMTTDPSFALLLKVALLDANGTLVNLATAANAIGFLPYADMPRVAAGATTTVVSWHNWSQLCGGGAVSWCTISDNGTWGRRIDAAGNPLGSGPFKVNVYDPGWQEEGAVAVLPSGRFAVAWSSVPRYDGCSMSPNCTPPPRPAPQDGSAAGTYGRLFDAAGADVGGGEFRINATTAGDQLRPAVAADGSGFFVAFESAGAIVGRRYAATLQPGRLDVDPTDEMFSDGNGVLENWEAVVLAPAWRNETGTAQALTTHVSSVAGPPGPTYEVVQPHADYGIVPHGAERNCFATGLCASVAVYGARPAEHWDAQFTETSAPGTLFAPRTRVLHVGDSFLDVPRSSPFYRFVETVFHHDAMPPCAPGYFCPFFEVTRETMAPAVLKAASPGFTPPPCVPGGERFLDVPASSPYCPWIEELARDRVVAGCGGGNYCPQAAVSRETMAVYLLLTREGTGYVPPACTAPVFADVPASSPFCRWIEELARRGIVAGCGGGNYCPFLSVARDQMSVFVSATFGLLLYAP